MVETIQFYFLMFIVYAFLGWCVEVFLKFIDYKRFINRGFLIGPYLPIYGFGALFITLLLQKYINDLIVLFAFSTIICSTLEYFTSFIMEKTFCTRWWDYSKRKFNLNGRICLVNMILFGLLGILIIKFINPIFSKICKLCNQDILNIICLIVGLIFIIDIIISTIILISVRKESKLFSGDSTEKMSNKVYNKIKNIGWGYRRLLNAFPEVHNIGRKAINYINKKRKKYIKKEQELIKKSEQKLEKIQDHYNEKIKKIRRKSNKVISKIERK